MRPSLHAKFGYLQYALEMRFYSRWNACMAHRYGIPIHVEASNEGEPVSFSWRGWTYTVEEVIGRWHLVDRWWVPRVSSDFGHAKGHSDRFYYQVQCEGLAFFDLYYGSVVNEWVMDRVLD